MIVGLLLALAIARHLGPSEFGLYSFILSLVALVTAVTTLGADQVARREFVRQPDQASVLLGTCFFCTCLSSGLTFLLFLLGILGSGMNLKHSVLYLLLGGTILFVPFRFVDLWFQSQTRGDLSTKASLFALFVFTIVKLAALLADSSLFAFCLIYLLEILSLSLIQFGLYWAHYKVQFPWRFSLKRAKSIFGESWPLLLSTVAISIYSHIDQVMLKLYLGDGEVGVYAAAVKVSTIWNFFPIILAASLFPAIVDASAAGRALLYPRLQQYFHLNSGLAYAFVVPVAVAAPWLISLFYGEAYSEGSAILRVHVWSTLFVFLGVARNQHLITESFLKFSLFATVLGAVINIGLNLFWIPRYGGLGAAWATIFSYALSAYLSSLFMKNLHAIFIMQTRSLCLIFNPLEVIRTVTSLIQPKRSNI